jgi:anthranilate phosphoribosyltransferase
MIYEANASSSACRLRRFLQVETSTPPETTLPICGAQAHCQPVQPVQPVQPAHQHVLRFLLSRRQCLPYSPRVLRDLLEQLGAGHALTDGQIGRAVAALVDEAVPVEAKAQFLTALALKGESTDEIACFARQLRDRSISPVLDPSVRAADILDVCGTGGDRLNTFNISTTVALVLASAGVTVAKHGNRAITSQSGSADVLEALGIRVDLSPDEAANFLREHQFAFFFAPKYHPAFKHIGPARKLCAERGQRTIFNFLGPLLNPVRPSCQLIGVPRPELCEPMARVLKTLGARRGMVVSGSVNLAGNGNGPGLGPGRSPGGSGHASATPASTPAFLDELSTLGDTTVAEFYQDRGFATSSLEREHFPLQKASLADLAGGNREANAIIVRRVLGGEERGPKRDAVLLNSAAALFVAGRVRNLSEGWDTGGELIDSGRAQAKLEELVAASRNG